MSIGETIEEIGWEQGCFLPADLVCQLQTIGAAKAVLPEDCLYMIVSQSCDLVHHDLQAEPWCEVLQLQKIGKVEGLCENGRSPRKYHLHIKEKGIEIASGATSSGRYFLKRELLSNTVPNQDLEISRPNLAQVVKWLANRYTRPALPTAFNKRVRADPKNLKKLKTLLEDHHWLFRDFFLRLNTWEELSDPEFEYKFEVLLVAHENAFLHSKAVIDTFKQQFRELFKTCKGVNLVDVLHLPGSRTSLLLLDDYVAWDDFDYLTVPGEEITDATSST